MKDSYPKIVTILNGTKISDVLQLEEGYYLSGFIYPAMTTSVAFIFQVSADGITYNPLYDSTGARFSVIIPSAAAGASVLSTSIANCWRFIKLEVTDNQTGDKSITCISKKA